MEQKISSISLKGIGRGLPDHITQDGFLDEIINMRNKDGAWRPVGIKDTELYQPFDQDDIVYYHPDTIGRKMVYYDVGTKEIVTFFDVGVEQVLMTLGTSEVFESFSHIHKALIVATSENKYIFVFDIDTEEYTLLPDIDLLVTVTDFAAGDWTSQYSETHRDVDVETMTHISTRRSLGYFDSEIFVRYAFRLFDGSYIWPSELFYIKLGTNSSGAWDYGYEVLNGTPVTYRSVNIRDGQLSVSIGNYQGIDAYEGLIKSVDFFITYPHQKIISEQEEGATMQSSDKPPLDEINYYNVLSVPISDVSAGYNNTFTLPSVEEIPSLPLLPVDPFTHHKITGKYSLTYNDRLHYANTKTYLFSGYNMFRTGSSDYRDVYTTLPNTYSPLSSWTDVRIIVYLKTNEGEKILYRIEQAPLWFDGATYMTILRRNFIYPDSRATKVDVCVVSGNTWRVWNSFEMSAHPYRNFAYTDITGPFGTEGDDLDQHYAAPLYNVSLPLFDQSTLDNVLTDTNRVQVSEASNPLVLKAENSYVVGNPDFIINGIAIELDAMSEGQYGKFPVYISTNRGWWTLESGQGDVLYSNAINISNTICTNETSIISLRGAVLFVGVDAIYSIQGRKVSPLSTDVRGDPSTYLRSFSQFEDITNNSEIVQLKSQLSHLSILEFIQLAIVCFDQTENEIIFSIPGTTNYYSYVFELNTGVWHTISIAFDHFIDRYTGYLGQNSAGYLMDMSVENYQDSETDSLECLIQTRPIDFEGSFPKRMFQSFLRGNIEIDNFNPDEPYEWETKYFAVYIFASNDGKAWVWLNGRKLSAVNDENTFEDVKYPKIYNTFRYVVFVITGKLLKDSFISNSEITYGIKYNRKLR